MKWKKLKTVDLFLIMYNVEKNIWKRRHLKKTRLLFLSTSHSWVTFVLILILIYISLQHLNSSSFIFINIAIINIFLWASPFSSWHYFSLIYIILKNNLLKKIFIADMTNFYFCFVFIQSFVNLDLLTFFWWWSNLQDRNILRTEFKKIRQNTVGTSI